MKKNPANSSYKEIDQNSILLLVNSICVFRHTGIIQDADNSWSGGGEVGERRKGGEVLTPVRDLCT